MEVEGGEMRRGKGRRVELEGGQTSDRVVSSEWPVLLRSGVGRTGRLADKMGIPKRTLT